MSSQREYTDTPGRKGSGERSPGSVTKSDAKIKIPQKSQWCGLFQKSLDKNLISRGQQCTGEILNMYCTWCISKESTTHRHKFQTEKVVGHLMDNRFYYRKNKAGHRSPGS